MKAFKGFTALLAAMSLCGCMATASIPGERDLAGQLRRGEKISVYTRDGSVTTMFFGKATERELTGSEVVTPYTLVSIPRENITEVHAERVHAGRTVAAIGLGAVLVPVMLLLCGMDADQCFADQ